MAKLGTIKPNPILSPKAPMLPPPPPSTSITRVADLLEQFRPLPSRYFYGNNPDPHASPFLTPANPYYDPNGLTPELRKEAYRLGDMRTLGLIDSANHNAKLQELFRRQEALHKPAPPPPPKGPTLEEQLVATLAALPQPQAPPTEARARWDWHDRNRKG